MKTILNRLAGILLSFFCFSSAYSKNHSSVSDLPHLTVNCKVFDREAKTILWQRPENFCLFRPDGQLVIASSEFLSLLDAQGNSVWKVPVHVHHGITLTSDHRILVMSSAIHNYKGKKVRFDKLIKYNFDGSVFSSFDFYDHLKIIGPAALPIIKNGAGNRTLEASEKIWGDEVNTEYSHTNSIQEIPENVLAAENPAFSRGNFLVNVNWLGVLFVLDKDLKKILWIKDKVDDHEFSIYNSHDMQMQSNGWILTYANKLTFFEKSSAIVELQPLTGQRRVLFQGSPPKSFFGLWAGGVQRLPSGNLLTSHHVGGGKIVEVNSKNQIVRTRPYPLNDPVTGKGITFSFVKAEDLTSFLKNNRSL